MKKLLMVITPLFFLITIYLIVDTYSLFESNHVTTSSVGIAKWQVKLNDSEIDGSASSFIINEVKWDESFFVAPGKVAPGVSGYFDIVIDPNYTDVSIRYDITFDFSDLSVNQFVIDSVIEATGKSLIKTGDSTYSAIILLDDIKLGVTNTIRVNMSWNNDELNNDADSLLGKVPNSSISIPVSVNIEQYMGEDITEAVNS